MHSRAVRAPCIEYFAALNFLYLQLYHSEAVGPVVLQLRQGLPQQQTMQQHIDRMDQKCQDISKHMLAKLGQLQAALSVDG